MFRITEHYEKLRPRHLRVEITIDFATEASKDEVIAALGAATGKALREIAEDFAERDSTT